MKESKLKTAALLAMVIGLAAFLAGASSNAFAEQLNVDDDADIGTVYRLKDIDRAKLDAFPSPLFQVAPIYPKGLHEERIEGWADLEWVIDKAGAVRKVKAVASSHVDFESPSVESIKKSKWKPAVKDGNPVNVLVRQRVAFKLKDK